MTEPELTLDTRQRDIVERTIAEQCRIRVWRLHAVNCRTQHVHVVVTAPNRDPEVVMDQFKAWCTRRLKEHTESNLKPESQAKDFEAQAKEMNKRGFAGVSGFNVGSIRQKWWTQRGSKRQLYDEASLEAAIRYVLEGQGDPPFALQ